MRKTMLALLIVAFAAPAFAVTTNSAPNTTLLKGFNATKNVATMYTTGCTATVNGLTTDNCWGASAGHASGDKNYATTSAFGGVAQKPVTPADTVAAPSAPQSPTDSTVPSGYTAM